MNGNGAFSGHLAGWATGHGTGSPIYPELHDLQGQFAEFLHHLTVASGKGVSGLILQGRTLKCSFLPGPLQKGEMRLKMGQYGARLMVMMLGTSHDRKAGSFRSCRTQDRVWALSMVLARHGHRQALQGLCLPKAQSLGSLPPGHWRAGCPTSNLIRDCHN